MSATDRAIIEESFMLLEAPQGDVALCGGGFLDFDPGDGVRRFTSRHPIYGVMGEPETFERAIGGQAENVTITLVPNPKAALTDWYREDLRNSRVRFWIGSIASDWKTVTHADQLADYFVDYPARVVREDGSELLELSLIARDSKLFFINEGNVLSESSHKRLYPNEDGLNNCRDVVYPVAWGTAAPPQGVQSGGGGGGSGAGFGVSLL